MINFDTLPINKLKKEILDHLKINKPLVISSSTGSGKSTCIPVWCANNCKTLVIEPRRLACKSIANTVSKVLNYKIGEQIGYSVRDDHKVSQNTTLLYATPGIVLQMISKNDLSGYSTIIVDEFHERRWDTDLILALLKKRFTGKLIILSATIDAKSTSFYLKGDFHHLDSRQFEIEIKYLSNENL